MSAMRHEKAHAERSHLAAGLAQTNGATIHANARSSSLTRTR